MLTGARRGRRLVAATLVTALALVLAAGAADATAPAKNACGAATASVLATADGQVTTDIYDNELSGQEVADDVRHIMADGRLAAAVAADDAASTLREVERIVYHPAWHIVRLLVRDAAGRTLATYGGRYTIAPVRGVLRSPAGAQIGSFVMSVQDDIGVTKLETRFVGDPIGIYLHGTVVAQRGGVRLPRRPPAAATLTLAGVRYAVVSLTFEAAPSGTLRAVLLVARPPRSLAAQSCDAVRAAEFGRVAMRLTHLLGPIGQHYYGYAYWVHVYTGADVFVRAPDGTQLASSDGSDPAALPPSGPLSYAGQSWLVFSFSPLPTARVYLLVPAS